MSFCSGYPRIQDPPASPLGLSYLLSPDQDTDNFYTDTPARYKSPTVWTWGIWPWKRTSKKWRNGVWWECQTDARSRVARRSGPSGSAPGRSVRVARAAVAWQPPLGTAVPAPPDWASGSQAWALQPGRDVRRTSWSSRLGGGIQDTADGQGHHRAARENRHAVHRSVGSSAPSTRRSLGAATNWPNWDLNRERGGGPGHADALRCQKTRTRRSSGGTLGHGRPDLLRLCFGPIVPRFWNRRWSIEQAWDGRGGSAAATGRRRLPGDDGRSNGAMPAVCVQNSHTRQTAAS